MKRNTLLSLGCALCAIAQAQVWCPTGATWHHEWFTLTETGYLETQYVSDTIIFGFPSQKISGTKIVYDYVVQSFVNEPMAPYFTSVANDLVSILTPNGFDTLYRFDAMPGDSWSVPLANDPTDLIVIDTGSTNIDGQGLRYLVVEYQPGGWSDTLIERIGGVWAYMDGTLSLGIDAPLLGLRCYQDQDFSFSTIIAPVCDFILGINQSGSSPSFGLFPNPTTDEVRVRLPASMRTARLWLTDLAGRVVLSPDWVNDGATVDVRGLTPGIYAVMVEGSSVVGRLVVE